jgi:hypothetical protein
MNARQLLSLSIAISLIPIAPAALRCFGAAPAPSNADSARIAANYSKLPLSFEAAPDGAPSHFLARGSGYSLFLSGSSATLVLGNPAACSVAPPPNRPAQTGPGRACASNARPERIHWNLKGATIPSPAPLTGEDMLPGKVNYLIGSDTARWRTGVSTYAKVRQFAAYPGIDLVYYGNQRQLEFDFVVAPGANPSAIQLTFTGQRRLRIAANGDLQIEGVRGQVALHKPLVYQESDGVRTPIAAGFHLAAGNSVTFRIGKYDPARPLIVDPVLVYSTFLGSSWSNSPGYGDSGNGIAVDAKGSVYVVGATYGITFPTTAGALQTTNSVADTGHGSNVFISKFNATGTALEYSTYLGGSGQANPSPYAYNVGDFGAAIAVDAAGDAYLTGWTYSSNFPTTTGAFQTVNKAAAVGFATAFVSKLNPAGSGLVYSTFLGGVSTGFEDPLQTDAGRAIAIDSAGNAYVAGFTRANNFPTTKGSYEAAQPNPANEFAPAAFVSKLNPQGSALVYSTYLGGYGCAADLACGTFLVGDQANAIAIDAAGDAYVAGSTYSTLFPTTKGAFQSVNHDAANGGANAFVSKLDPTGSKLLYSTYVGGSGVPASPSQYLPDAANAVAVDSAGNAYIAGLTASTDFPVTPGVFGPVATGAGTGFVTKLNATGTALTYSTFLGGDNASANAIAIDGSGVAYVAGVAVAGNLLLSADAVSKVGGAFIAKVKPDASGLDYATLLGGASGGDQALALALNASGQVYVTGETANSDFPITSGAFQSTIRSQDAFVTSLDLSKELDTRIATLTSLTSSAATTGGGQSVTLTAKVTPVSGSTVASGQVAFSGQVCSHYQFAYTGYYWANCTAIAASEATLNSAGVAELTVPSLKDGLYSYSATYLGDTTHAQSTTLASASPLKLLVSGPPAAISAAGGPEDYGEAFPVDVDVVDAAGYPMDGYTVNGAGHGLALSPLSAVTDSTGIAYFNATGVATGTEYLEFLVDDSKPETVAAITILKVPLAVQLRPASRLYGAALPSFSPIFTGLVNGDTVTVTPQSTATAASPVGVYPVTATVSGPASVNYNITVTGTTMTVTPAPLTVEASNEAVVYGQTPAPPTAYTLSGFVNGETASLVTGKPVLTTTVTSTTPVGFYPIGVAAGTLAAPNYYFKTVGNGMGTVGVYKAPLRINVANQTIHQGDPLPALTFTLTGFVNGDTAASAVTGAPVLSTTATSSSPPGHYTITATVGSLAAHNYSFSVVTGILTILP